VCTVYRTGRRRDGASSLLGDAIPVVIPVVCLVVMAKFIRVSQEVRSARSIPPSSPKDERHMTPSHHR
jgi:hypothetical protein